VPPDESLPPHSVRSAVQAATSAETPVFMMACLISIFLLLLVDMSTYQRADISSTSGQNNPVETPVLALWRHD
jgi:hypothetical protein